MALTIDQDAFSSGQIGSKIWLCEELERLYDRIDEIWIYGGWYGLTAFLLRSRNNINVKKIRSIDVDPNCEVVADMVNEYWKWQDWQFKSVTMDCNTVVPTRVDLIINTSTEHFESLEWFNQIPKGTAVALQGADMPHLDHVFDFQNLTQFEQTYPLNTVAFSGVKNFNYPEWSFNRFMLIGIK